jgi:lipopolysaccharide transport protein LptA
VKFQTVVFLASVAGAAVLAPASGTESPGAAPAPSEILIEAAPPKAGKGTNAAPRTVKITSDRASYLKKEGIVAFEGHVFVDDVEFKMHADEVSLFLDGTNSLKRLVAIGGVAVTNGTRYGSCAKATYNKALSRVVLYSDESKGVPARLNDNGKRKSQVEGRKITFWVDTEQVEVDGSVITVDVGNGDAKDSAKRFLGK